MASAPIFDEMDEADEQEAEQHPLVTLTQIAQAEGDISGLLDDQSLTTIGADVKRDYEIDLEDAAEWRATAEKALKRASQEREELNNPPPYRKSNINYPILAVAALQFNARAYPAICKPGSMVKCTVIGSDRGRPKMGPDGQPIVVINGQEMPAQAAQQVMAQAAQQQPQQGTDGQPVPPQMPQVTPAWQIPPGAKQKRADRVASYMNVYLQYRMDAWEEDTDQLLFEIPIVGCGFRKLWWDGGKQRACYVSALDLIVPIKAKTLEDAPRITEKLNDVFPWQIKRRMNTGEYRSVTLTQSGSDEETPRLLLEAQRWIDLDKDGVDEPYVVTVDHQTAEVLKIVPNFTVDDVKIDDERVVAINRKVYHVKYPFLPHPKGIFYGMGFGHLVEQVSDIVNTTLNQFYDAMHAQIAGGGWVAAGARLQGNSRSEVIRFNPGEYKTVNMSGGALRDAIVERTFPNISPVQFQILDLMLAAAKDLTSVKDILTGDVPNTAPVGTTLQVIQQAQMVFTAIYKRVYLALGNEFIMIYGNLAEHADDQGLAQDYDTVLDDPAANFAQDFSESDMDLKPVADPSNVTPMQQIAKAQFLLGFRGTGLNDMEINRRALEAGGIEDIDQLMPQGPAQPDPLAMAKAYQAKTAGDLNTARAQQASATATKVAVDVGHQLGESAGYGGAPGVSGVGGGSDDPMGSGGAGNAGAGAGGDVGAGIVQPAGA